MIDARIMGDNLEITVSGGDAWLLATRPSWSHSAPLSQVQRAVAGPGIGAGTRRHVVEHSNDRMRRPGRLICARRSAPTLRIDLDGGPFRQMVLSVPDPAGTAKAIEDAIAARPR